MDLKRGYPHIAIRCKHFTNYHLALDMKYIEYCDEPGIRGVWRPPKCVHIQLLASFPGPPSSAHIILTYDL